LLGLIASVVASATLVGCFGTHKPAEPPYAKIKPGTEMKRTGDEIMVAGQLFHTGTRVVLWMDEHGYDAYRVEKRFGPYDQSSWDTTTRPTSGPAPSKEVLSWTPNRYSMRAKGLTPEEIETVRGGGWTLPMLQDHVDQFVIHYDVAGVSQTCFKVLQDHRNLSVHFMLDVDGTIYQTLDLKERARQATIANDRSVGIEIANLGAYTDAETTSTLNRWYHKDPATGLVTMTIPSAVGDPMILTPNFVAHPDRNEMISGEIQGRVRHQYDFTPQQYAALTKLTATLCTIFPKLKCDYPKDEHGQLITHALSDEQYDKYQGLLGHYHVQTNKTDPGPAFQWDRVINGARQLMGSSPTLTASAK
jgi:N-acetyl-anhydromuramyl-L-alanine amidase AmpD